MLVARTRHDLPICEACLIAAPPPSMASLRLNGLPPDGAAMPLGHPGLQQLARAHST